MRYLELNFTYKNKDISKDISKSMLNFTYTDNEQGKADEIEILLENKNKLWSSSWYPNKGSIVQAGVTLYNWSKNGSNTKVNWGKFIIDDLTMSSNGTFTIKAISEKSAGSFQTEKKCRTFENISLKEICQKIADENNMKLYYKPEKNIKYSKLYQLYYTDASFIFMQCDKAGYYCKISGDKIFIYDSSIKNSNITLKPSDLSSYEFNSKTFGTYNAAEVKYFNPDTGEVITYKAVDNNIKTDSVLIIDKHADSSESAKSIAESELKKANNKEITGSFSLMGNPELFTGTEINIADVGVFAGNYIIEKVTHSISQNQGYVSTVECYLKK